MKIQLCSLLTIGCSLIIVGLNAQNQVAETREVLDQWVETRQIISEEKASWKVEESILGDTVQLLSSELHRLSEALTDLESSATAADEERSTLADEKEKLTAASAVVEANIGALESQLKRALKKLPEPLIEKIKPLIRRLPEDPSDTGLSLGERVQNIVGILSQADAFMHTTRRELVDIASVSHQVLHTNRSVGGMSIAFDDPNVAVSWPHEGAQLLIGAMQIFSGLAQEPHDEAQRRGGAGEEIEGDEAVVRARMAEHKLITHPAFGNRRRSLVHHCFKRERAALHLGALAGSAAFANKCFDVLNREASFATFCCQASDERPHGLVSLGVLTPEQLHTGEEAPLITHARAALRRAVAERQERFSQAAGAWLLIRVR